MTKLQRVLIMAGGTGGHVFPGLALGQFLQNQGIEVHWLGTGLGLEAELVPAANIPFHEIKIGGIRGKGITTLLQAPFKIWGAIRHAQRIMRDIAPDVVVGMGGYASGPGGVASWLCRYPLIIHEQNAKAGLTNKILSNIAANVLQAFPQSFKTHPKVVTIGNPVRAELTQLPPPLKRFANRPVPPLRLLVLGGSLGARALNELVPVAIKPLLATNSIQVLQQTGAKFFELAQTAYQQAGINVRGQAAQDNFLPTENQTVSLVPFIHSMAAAYAWADIVVCRAGALTIAELCAVGLGSILIPFPFAVDDHQTVNAQFLVQQQAALCIQQKDLTALGLTQQLQHFIEQPDLRSTMANAAYQLRKSDVSEQFFHVLNKVVGENI